MDKINFIKTFISEGQYRQKYENGEMMVYHINAELNKEMNAYECYECTLPKTTFDENKVKAAFAQFSAKMDAIKLEQAKAEKIADIAAYDTSSAVNGFMLNGAEVWLDFELRDRVYQGNERLQRIGRTDTTLWLGKQCYNLSIEQAQNIISHIEAYAKDCYNVTAAHKKAVAELTDIAEVLTYDYTKGYPAKLTMEV